MSLRLTLAAVCMCALTTSRAASIEQRVNALTARAMAEPTAAGAETRLAAAERLLRNEGSGIGELARGLLKADINRARGRAYVAVWQRNPAETKLRDQAERCLTQALKEYERLQKLCEEEANRREADLGPAVEKDKKYREACGNVSRTNYAMAWAEYSLGLASATKSERDAHLKKAVERFVSFTASGYKNHPVVTDCFLGQALCLYQLKRYYDITQLLRDATPANTPPDTFKRMQYHLLQAHQALGSHLKVETLAEHYFNSLKPDHKLDAIELEMALARARSLAHLVKSHDMPKYQRKFRASLQEVTSLVRPYGNPWCAQLVEALGESESEGAFVRLTRAREHFRAKQFKEALEEAGRGIDLARSEADDPFLPDLRYAQVAASWNLNRWGDAHAAAFDFLRKHPKDRRAAEVCRLAVQAALRARTEQPPLPPERVLAFMAFVQDSFPKHPEAKKAPWYCADLLLQQELYQEAEQVLRPIRPQSPVYRRALYGLALAAYKQAEALAAKKDVGSAAAAKHLSRAAAAASRFADAANKGLPPGEQPLAKAVADIATAAARLYLDLPTPNPAAALAILERTNAMPEIDDKAASQRLALTIVANVLAGNVGAATTLLDKLMKQKAEDPNAANALIAIADPLEQEYERAAAAQKKEAGERLAPKLVSLYAFLLDHGQPGATGGQEPALRRRLARSHQRLGQHREAIVQYEWLLAHVPREKSGDVLRGLAIAYQQTRQYDSAIDMWRTLSRGLGKKTEGWFEARCSLIQCHAKAGRVDQARKLMQYFRLQYSQIPFEEWWHKFNALERELAAGSHDVPAARP